MFLILLTLTAVPCMASLCSQCECLPSGVVNCADLHLNNAPTITMKEKAELGGEGIISFRGNPHMMMTRDQVDTYLTHFSYLELDSGSPLCVHFQESVIPSSVQGCLPKQPSEKSHMNTLLVTRSTPKENVALDVDDTRERLNDLGRRWIINTAIQWAVYLLGLLTSGCFIHTLFKRLLQHIETMMLERGRKARRTAVARNALHVPPARPQLAFLNIVTLIRLTIYRNN